MNLVKLKLFIGVKFPFGVIQLIMDLHDTLGHLSTTPSTPHRHLFTHTLITIGTSSTYSPH